jgi:hypothetical protein
MTRPIERTHSGQIIPKEKKEYNERLFKKGWRRYLHESRYLWLRKKLKQLELADVSILELGCFDAKTIDYLPFGFSKYAGYDANWENGLDLGKKRWKNNPAVQLVESDTVSGFNTGNERFDCTIAMETLEHLKAGELEQYIEKLAAATKQYLFITVPYERGVPLLLKYVYKAIRFKVDEPYSLKELFYAVKGDLYRVSRVEGGHKGFDHRQLLKLISVYFEIKEVNGLPVSFLPTGMNFSVGIVAVPLRA